LQLIIKSYKCAKAKETKSQILDILLDASNKYSNKYDWILAYFSCLDTELMFQKLLIYGFNEFSSSDSSIKQSQSGRPNLPRINVISFYAKSFPYMIYNEIITFLTNQPSFASKSTLFDDRKIFILRVTSQSHPLLIVLLNKLLNTCNTDDNRLLEMLKSLLNNENAIKNELFECLNQLNNSIGVYEIILGILEWLSIQNRPVVNNYKKICKYIVIFSKQFNSSRVVSEKCSL
jgi:hypothetical protein